MNHSTFPCMLHIHCRFLGSNFMASLPQSRIWGSHSAAVEDSSRMLHRVDWYEQLLKCHRTLLPSSLGSSRPSSRTRKPNLWSGRPTLGWSRPHLGFRRLNLRSGRTTVGSSRPNWGPKRPTLVLYSLGSSGLNFRSGGPSLGSSKPNLGSRTFNTRYIKLNGRTIHERWTGKDLEGNGRYLIEALSRYLPWGTENDH